MLRSMLKSKIHRATVTEADLNYVGSITIDEDLMDAANLVTNETVWVVNCNNGARLETYVISGERGKGEIKLNGAAARLVQPGDIVIIICYAFMTEEEVKSYKPDVVFVDNENKMIKHGDDSSVWVDGTKYSPMHTVIDFPSVIDY